jgi:hypothetical protein
MNRIYIISFCKILVLAAFCLLFSEGARGAEFASSSLATTGGALIYTDAECPHYLYTWKTAESLSGLVNGIGPDGRLTRLGGGHSNKIGLFRIWKNLEKIAPVGALFTHINPLGAVYGGAGEEYGDQLLKIEIDFKRAKTILIEENDIYGAQLRKALEENFEFPKADIIVRKGPIQEVIILNPAVIKNYTADPQVLKADLRDWLAEFERSGRKLPENQQHIKDKNRGILSFDARRMERQITAVIERDPGLLPAKLRRSMSYSGHLPWTSTPPPPSSIDTVHDTFRRLEQVLSQNRRVKPELVSQWRALLTDSSAAKLYEAFEKVPFDKINSIRQSVIHAGLNNDVYDLEVQIAGMLRYAESYSSEKTPSAISNLKKYSAVYDWIKRGNDALNAFHEHSPLGALPDPFAKSKNCEHYFDVVSHYRKTN